MSERVEKGRIATDALIHYGVKGMKWGVRRERRASTKAAKKLAKADKKYNKSLSGVAGFVKIHNTVAKHTGRRLEALNENPKYKDKDLYADPKLNKQYLKDYEKLIDGACKDAMDEIGANPSGTIRIKITRYGELEESTWSADFEEIKHADESVGFPSFRIVPKFNKTGHIIDQTFSLMSEMTQGEEFVNELIHYGVKGMKWGVRRDRSSRVSISAKRKGIKTSGGAGRKPSEDAKRAAVIGQVGKKSGLSSLTNEQLQAYNNRLNLEANVRRLEYQKKNRGQKFVDDLINKSGNQTTDVVAQEVVAKRVKKALISAALAAA